MLDKLSKQTERNQEWLAIVLDDFSEFLKDHAECERRASNMAMNIVAKHPEKDVMAEVLIDLGINKLKRFQSIYMFMRQTDVPLPQENAHDLYVKQLQWLIRNGKEERFLDKLLVNGIIEAREQERLSLLCSQLKDGNARTFYTTLTSTSNPYEFIAAKYFLSRQIDGRLKELAEEEKTIFAQLDLRPALH